MKSRQYAKILKKNLEATIPGLIEHVLHIKAVVSEELPDDRNVGPVPAYEGTKA